MVKNLRSLGKTVLLTTHYMDEAEVLANRVAIIVNGEIVAEGPPSELVRKNGATSIRFRLAAGSTPLPDGLNVELNQAANGESNGRQDAGLQYTISTDAPTDSLYRLTAWAVEHGIELEEISVSSPTLEDLFVQLARPLDHNGPEP